MCNVSWTPHSNLEKDNCYSVNHSYVSPKMGCLEYYIQLYITKNSTTTIIGLVLLVQALGATIVKFMRKA